MKKHFITGLVILLPLAVTLAIVIFIVNLFTNPFVDMIQYTLQSLGWLQNGFLFFSSSQIQLYVSKMIILVLLLTFIIGLGALTRSMVAKYFVKISDTIFHQIPFVRSIYKTSKDVINTIFGTTTRSFKQVVLAPFPNRHTQCLGLVTREHVLGIGKDKDKNFVAVFVPTTPNPTSGFLMMFNSDDLIYLDMTVEEAFKYIISCGVILTPFNKVMKDPK